MFTIEEKMERRRSIGASETGDVCGVGFRTPLHVYLSKIGEYEQPDNAQMNWGRKLEAVVGEAYREESGNPVLLPQAKTYHHPELSWVSASPDFLTVVAGEQRVLECKTSRYSDEWGEPGTDDIPDMYILQVHQQMFVLGLQTAEVAVLIAGSEFRRYTVPFNRNLMDKILNIEGDLWKRVQERNPPDPTWSHPSTPELVRRLWGVDASHSLELGPEAHGLAERYDYLRTRSREIDDERDSIKAQLIHMGGHAGLIRLPGGWSIHRKLVKRSGYTVAPTEYHSFRVKGPKESEVAR